MTELLLSIDPAVVSVLVVVWAWAGRRAVGLPYAANARMLRRRTGGLMVLAGMGELFIKRHTFAAESWFGPRQLASLDRLREGGIPIGTFDPTIPS